jgi:hypothetical protein
MEPHQRLEVFLPKLLAALERKGLSEAAVVFAWKSVMAGSINSRPSRQLSTIRSPGPRVRRHQKFSPPLKTGRHLRRGAARLAGGFLSLRMPT